MAKQCYRCSSGIQMPDGSAWCGVTMKPESGIGCSYSSGIPRLYKLEPVVIQKEKLVTRSTTSIPKPKVKPISTKQKPVISRKKATPPQQKLF